MDVWDDSGLRKFEKQKSREIRRSKEVKKQKSRETGKSRKAENLKNKYINGTKLKKIYCL